MTWVRVGRQTHFTSNPGDGLIITVFTDGSKIDNKKENQWGTGAGYAIFIGHPIESIDLTPPAVTGQVNLCHSLSVFQAEIIAIHQAVTHYHKARTQNLIPSPTALVIYSDSQAAIKALAAAEVKSKTVESCKRLLNATAILNPLHVKWVKAHATSQGNNYVDLLAKPGAQTQTEVGPFPRKEITLAFIRLQLRREMIASWEEEWAAHQSCRQTKLWCPTPNESLSRNILGLNREEIGRIIRWLTGHNFLRRHANIINPIHYSNPKCRLCGMDEETSSHILTDCMALDFERFQLMKSGHLPHPYRWKLKQVSNFLEKFGDLLEDDTDLHRPISILTRSSSRMFILDPIAVPGLRDLDDSETDTSEDAD